MEAGQEEETLTESVERLWGGAIAKQQLRSSGHSLDRRFGSSATWPGYYVVRASVALRAQSLAAESAPLLQLAKRQGAGGPSGSSIRERKFTSFGGKLVGRPDVIRSDEIVDYKSGAIMECDEATHAEVIKAAYVRQLRIYGFLVKETLGQWPKRGVLLPFAGASVEIALEPSDCAREATEAVALLDTYNAKVRANEPHALFATPSLQSCRWCPYKLLCPPFWQTASPEWSGQLDGAAVEGVLATEPTEIHAGAARALSLDVVAGSESLCRAQITPLNPAVHHSVTSLAAGDRVRLVGLRVRPDGVLAPSQRTVLARVTDLPSVTLATGRPG